MAKKITNRKVGRYTVVEDTVRIGQDTYKTEELMSDKELKLLQAKKCTCKALEETRKRRVRVSKRTATGKAKTKYGGRYNTNRPAGKKRKAIRGS